MKSHSLHVGDIEIGERHRALSEDAVQRLAASMKDIGLRQPISIRVVDEMVIDGAVVSGVPVLVAGRHRLAAATMLGWTHIDCIEIEDDAIAAELWEIAENLHRLDLTKEQRDEHIRRYAELLEARRVVSQQIASKPKSGPQGGRPTGIPRQIAEETGLSVDTVRRALNPPSLQPKPVRSDHDVILAQANAIVAAWNRACPEARDIALQQIDGPVFDNARAA
jgi:ParB family chromosome partitioning protein